jgi:hypothetical protein
MLAVPPPWPVVFDGLVRRSFTLLLRSPGLFKRSPRRRGVRRPVQTAFKDTQLRLLGKLARRE